ncbi:ribbon-helix-helix protein, CopG family [Pelagibacterium halotolerans]|uniref:ribbon-helix-helix protein, CopG family n=1 Tax=Pelagibacterium halotolerans TaxID=531813 RepID=UPI00384F1E9C
MRTLIDIKEPQLRQLDLLAKKEKRPRAALIREAIGAYLDQRSEKAVTEAFGLWGQREVDGLAYQNKIREEW